VEDWDVAEIAQAEQLDNLENAHCAVIVNTQHYEHIPEVKRLFAELNATDFPHKMGTLRRQMFLYPARGSDRAGIVIGRLNAGEISCG